MKLRSFFNILPAAGCIAAGLFALSSCGGDKAPRVLQPGEKAHVFCSIAPVAGLTREIAGDLVDIHTLVGPDQDPHNFSPAPKQLVDLGNSFGFFTIGMPFEETLVEKLRDSSTGLRIVDVSEGIEKLEMEDDHESHEGHDHGHDHHHHHDHEEGDPHIWLSPALLKSVVNSIAASLAEIDPSHADAFKSNASGLEGRIDELNAELSEKLTPLKGQSFYVYHGAFAYFAKAFGLEQEAIEIGGRSPEPKRIFELIEKAKSEGVKIIFVQPQFDSSSAETIAREIGGSVVAIDPLEEDIFANLRRIAESVSKVKN